MTLVPATSADLPAVAALVNGAYRGESARVGWANEADYVTGARVTLADLQATLADPAVHLLLLWGGGEGEGAPLLGCVQLNADDGRRWFLGMLTVRPDLQAKGTGRTLLADAEAYAQARGARRIRMTVVSIRDTLIAWYERRGYADTGERLPYTYGGALRPLDFAVLEKPL